MWWSVFEKGVWVLIVGCVFYLGLQVGMGVRDNQCFQALTNCQDQCFKSKRAIYGEQYHYFEYRGVMYFVKNAKDLDNQRKWIRVK